jgi:hypothetical protein
MSGIAVIVIIVIALLILIFGSIFVFGLNRAERPDQCENGQPEKNENDRKNQGESSD